jgi:23S rRNA U2552 (ribose-2'-O)-methylase RlmE/FtsJ
MQFSYDTLRVGGHLVCKFYQGSEDKQLEAKLKKLFAVVHREKPESSRGVSLHRQSTTLISGLTLAGIQGGLFRSIEA